MTEEQKKRRAFLLEKRDKSREEWEELFVLNRLAGNTLDSMKPDEEEQKERVEKLSIMVTIKKVQLHILFPEWWESELEIAPKQIINVVIEEGKVYLIYWVATIKEQDY